MSLSGPSNDKPTDPYKEKNLDTETSVEGKVNDLIEFITKCKLGMMTTRDAASGMLVSRCMAIAGTENGIDLVFHTNTATGKSDELNNDPHVNISFLRDSDWASISGTAQVIQDTEEVKKHYSSTLKAWVGDLGDGVHDGSVKDPRLGVIKVRALTATYAIAHAASITRTLEVAKGAVTGNVASVNTLREITLKDIELWRRSKELVT
ncbi:hypothetical protein TWF102_011610 [Orbilia oligospora]|uniref:General stress protein FMN-binding split barrel domain-containing protein n=1 Tax=Orbilia oligospora TaxID=2813651 RepID=A0A7C8NLM6_ORBOL|nr:hypothetical protein TWF103_003036 [Orbilia oligospora]KAF3085290.1 hypothetical protein TWF102_011610 [Orbilia oligospora]KAF3089512.1 hypothetical protein TWF706_010379 [Orbilia oligospora]KAF3119090.1 hypothetical protein TWF703_003780 [Orbilia oligospora]KAF3124501.1 hypothetical protein TWF594_002008 [Orbilia oligospora]